MPILLRTCCGCCELRIGVVIIAVVELCMATYGIYAAYLHSEERQAAFQNSSTNANNQTSHEKTAVRLEKALFMTEVSIGSIDMLASSLLLIGAVVNNPKYRLINHFWIAWTGLVIGALLMALVVLSLASVSAMSQVWLMITYGGCIIIELYCMLVVYSYHVQLREREAAQMTRELPVYYVPAPSQPDTSQPIMTESFPTEMSDEPPPYEVAVGLPPSYSEQDLSNKKGKNLPS